MSDPIVPSRRVALLRGINVGGRNRLPMADLRAVLGSIGLVGVRTHIQSGNVVFDVDVGVERESPLANDAELAIAISNAVRRSTSLDVKVVVLPLDQLAAIATSHPDDGGDIPPNHLHVFVLDGDADPDAAPASDQFEPDRFSVGDREVYVTYPGGSARSKLTIDVFERAFARTATARNLNTIRKIVALGVVDP
ncbi:MAG: DUF1697 domain-containing protein [Ilumatobacteraceae bacterium]